MSEQLTIEQMKQNVFYELRTKEVPYSVVITKNHFTDMADYFVVIHKSDRDSIDNFIFVGTTYNKMTKEYTLKDHEIEFFKDNIEDYKKIMGSEYGAIYETHDVSFKQYYQSKLNLDSWRR